MNNFSYELQVSKEPTIGLVVLQADQRIELDMRQLFGVQLLQIQEGLRGGSFQVWGMTTSHLKSSW